MAICRHLYAYANGHHAKCALCTCTSMYVYYRKYLLYCFTSHLTRITRIINESPSLPGPFAIRRLCAGFSCFLMCGHSVMYTIHKICFNIQIRVCIFNQQQQQQHSHIKECRLYSNYPNHMYLYLYICIYWMAIVFQTKSLIMHNISNQQ